MSKKEAERPKCRKCDRPFTKTGNRQLDCPACRVSRKVPRTRRATATKARLTELVAAAESYSEVRALVLVESAVEEISRRAVLLREQLIKSRQ